MAKQQRRMAPDVFIDPLRRSFVLAGLAGLAGCGGGGGDAGGPSPVPAPAPPAPPISGSLDLLAGAIGVSGNADGAAADARFFSPYGLAADAAGNLYVADQGNNAIRRVAPDGAVTTLTVPTSGLVAPLAVAVDRAGNVYTTGSSSIVSRITAAGIAEPIAGGASGYADGVGAAARFVSPPALVCDSNGAIFVADHGNEVIRKVLPDGTVTTFAGRAGAFGNVDGTGSQARFSGPLSITIDAQDNLYVFDSSGGDATLRRITPAGVVTTIGGFDYWEITHAGTSRNAVGNGLATAGGSVFVADNYNVVRQRTANGALRIVAGAYGDADAVTGALPAKVGIPVGLAVLPSGQLAIASLSARCIFVTRSAVF
jgi:streptogramin lyase